MIEITKEEFEGYIKATNNKKSYLIEDHKKSSLSVGKYIYIADHFNELTKKFKGQN